MAFENSQTFLAESKKLAGTHQFEISCRFEAQEGKPIKKILSISALPKIVSSEKLAENIDFSGRTTYQITYETEEGKLTSILAATEWQNKLNMNVSNYVLCPTIVENTITGVSSSEVTISSLVELDVYHVAGERITSVSGLPEGFVSEEKNYDYDKFVNMTTESFNEVAEHEYKGKIEEILVSNGVVRLKNKAANVDSIIIEGELAFSINVLDSGRVVSIDKTLEFKQELAALSVVPNNIIDATIRLNDLKVSASVNETDNKTNLIIAYEIGVCAFAFSKETMTITQDAFSLNKQVNATYECVQIDNFEAQEISVDNLTGTFEVEPEIYEICFVSSAQARVSELKKVDNMLEVVGALMVEAVCETETRDRIKVQGTIPFTTKVQGDACYEGTNVYAKVSALKLRNSKEFEVFAELYIESKKQESQYINYLSQLEETGEEKEPLSAIKVYVATQGDDLFNIAKTLSVKPETILYQNPKVEEGITAGDRIVIYSPLDINF